MELYSIVFPLFFLHHVAAFVHASFAPDEFQLIHDGSILLFSKPIIAHSPHTTLALLLRRAVVNLCHLLSIQQPCVVWNARDILHHAVQYCAVLCCTVLCMDGDKQRHRDGRSQISTPQNANQCTVHVPRAISQRSRFLMRFFLSGRFRRAIVLLDRKRHGTVHERFATEVPCTFNAVQCCYSNYYCTYVIRGTLDRPGSTGNYSLLTFQVMVWWGQDTTVRRMGSATIYCRIPSSLWFAGSKGAFRR